MARSPTIFLNPGIERFDSHVTHASRAHKASRKRGEVETPLPCLSVCLASISPAFPTPMRPTHQVTLITARSTKLLGLHKRPQDHSACLAARLERLRSILRERGYAHEAIGRSHRVHSAVACVAMRQSLHEEQSRAAQGGALTCSSDCPYCAQPTPPSHQRSARPCETRGAHRGACSVPA